MSKQLYLSNRWISTLFVYYFFVLLIGIYLAISTLVNENKEANILVLAIEGSIGMAMNGSAIFYIRKLYKLCFSDSKLIISGENHYKEKLATIIYFLARPLFSIGFALLIVIGFKSGFMTTSATEVKLNEGFVFITMFISFFVGFLAGKFIKGLERYGSQHVVKGQSDE